MYHHRKCHCHHRQPHHRHAQKMMLTIGKSIHRQHLHQYRVWIVWIVGTIPLNWIALRGQKVFFFFFFTFIFLFCFTVLNHIFCLFVYSFILPRILDGIKFKYFHSASFFLVLNSKSNIRREKFFRTKCYLKSIEKQNCAMSTLQFICALYDLKT